MPNYKMKNMIGEKLGSLEIIGLSETELTKKGTRKWICKCECGNIVYYETRVWNDLKKRVPNTSCGCRHYGGYLGFFTEENRLNKYKTQLRRICDINFDMRDYQVSCDIVKEWREQFAEQPFNKSVFDWQDNNDGQLFIDIQEKTVKYCFTKFTKHKQHKHISLTDLFNGNLQETDDYADSKGKRTYQGGIFTAVKGYEQLEFVIVNINDDKHHFPIKLLIWAKEIKQ